jgi:hypothetical protein
VNVHPGKMKLTTRCVEMQTFDRHWMWRQNKVLNLEQRPPMKIIAYDSFKPGITMETIKPYLKDEVANVWRLWKAGIVRKITRAPTSRVSSLCSSARILRKQNVMSTISRFQNADF